MNDPIKSDIYPAFYNNKLASHFQNIFKYVI